MVLAAGAVALVPYGDVVVAIIEALEKLDLHYPAVTKEQRAALAVAKKRLG